MKELIEEIMNHCDGIIDRSERMTSGNYMHNCAANKFSAKIIKSCVNNLTNGGIQWQTGVPKENGEYLVSLEDGSVCRDEWRELYCEDDIKCWVYNEGEVTAWCKLSDIKPYKEEE